MNLNKYSKQKWQNALKLRKNNQFQEAEKELKEALEEQPHHPLLNASLAQLYLKQGRVKEARILAESVLTQAPQYPQALYVLGEVYLQEDHIDDALQCFQQAHEHDPSPYVTLGVVKALKKKDRNQEALEMIDGALLNNRNHIGLLKEKAIILDRMKSSDEALRIYERVKDLDPDDSFAAKAVYKLRSLKRPAHEVIQELQKVLNLSSHKDDAQLHGLLGEKLREAGRFKEAADEYKKAYELAPDNVFFIKQEGFCRNRLKEYPEAIRLLGEAFRRDPTDFIVKKTIKKLYSRTGDDKGLIQLIEDTLKEHPHNVKLMGTLKRLKKNFSIE
ncbi:MAG: tetratricopeptide repeat protein [Deltaproteobacteria bacterium]|nr:tetratricopeptide repeat protein [Deltaproteobacteria bacterium]